MDCDYCDESFDSTRAHHDHVLEHHGEELSSHDRDALKRERNQLADAGAAESSGLPLPRSALAAIAVVVVGGAALVMTGAVNLSTGHGPGGNSSVATDLGAPGTAHQHAAFSVVVDGERVDFSKPQYQVSSTRNRYIHFEGGDGSTIHKHATGVTIAYALETLDMAINQSCLTLADGTTHCEGDGGDLTITAGGNEVAPDTVIRDGVPVRIAYDSG